MNLNTPRNLPNTPTINRANMRLNEDWYSFIETLVAEVHYMKNTLDELDTENASMQLKVIQLEDEVKKLKKAKVA